MNIEESKLAIDSAADFSFEGPTTPYFELGTQLVLARFVYTVYAWWSPTDNALEELTNRIVGEISQARDNGKVGLAWRWGPENEPHMVSPNWNHYDEDDLELCEKQRNAPYVQDGFKANMRFVLFDQNLKVIQLLEELIKEEGVEIKRG